MFVWVCSLLIVYTARRQSVNSLSDFENRFQEMTLLAGPFTRVDSALAYLLSSHTSKITELIYTYCIFILLGTAVVQWLRCCATNRKVAGSIPAGVSGFFIDTKSYRSHYGPGVDSASNRNEYQEYFLGLKAAGA